MLSYWEPVKDIIRMSISWWSTGNMGFLIQPGTFLKQYVIPNLYPIYLALTFLIMATWEHCIQTINFLTWEISEKCDTFWCYGLAAPSPPSLCFPLF